MTLSPLLLVVDDSRADLELTTVTLRAAFPGATIHPCADPLTVWDLCNANPFDCVLLDYNMPRMDGLTLTSGLRTRFAYLPIILLTGCGDEMLAARALQSGVSDYLPKSHLSARSIRRTVDHAVETCGQARLIHEQKTELENFGYALAHDFKQPIRQISTFARMVSEEMRSDEGPEVHAHLTFLGAAARRLGDLVDVMVQYTLLSQPPELANVEMSAVFDGVRAAIGPFLTERAGEFVTPDAAPIVRGNPTLMIQVFQNLIVNGLLYNRSANPKVEVTIVAEQDAWALAVADNGIGIEAEFLSEIFKPLSRLHTALEYAGSGFGLALARKAINAQGGAIWCESTPGVGSIFHIRLPRSVVAGSGPKGPPAQRSR